MKFQTAIALGPTVLQVKEIEDLFISEYARVMDGESESYRDTAIRCALARVWTAGRLLGQREELEKIRKGIEGYEARSN